MPLSTKTYLHVLVNGLMVAFLFRRRYVPRPLLVAATVGHIAYQE